MIRLLVELLEVELTYTIVFTLTFVGLYIGQGDRSPIGRHILTFSAAVAIEAGVLLWALLGAPAGTWYLFVLALAFGITNVAVTQRLWLLFKFRGYLPMIASWLNARRKAIAAAVTAGLIAAQTALPMSPTWHGWVAVAIAVLGTGAVHQVRNITQPAAAPEPELEPA